MTLLVMYFEWSVYMLFVSAAISGFSGFAPVLMVGATSYIADISTKEERAYRIGELRRFHQDSSVIIEPIHLTL